MSFFQTIVKNIDQMNRGPEVMRKFGFALTAVLIIFSGMIVYKHSNDAVALTKAAIIFCSLAIVTLIISFTKPMILRPLNTIMIVVSMIIGTIMTKVMLGLLYYTLFSGVSLVLKILGYDKMNRKIKKQVKSYWVPKKEKFNRERCKRLF